MLCPRYCRKFHEVLRIQLMPFSHQTIPSAYIQNFLVLPLISTLIYCSSWVTVTFLTEAELEAAFVPSRKC